MTRSVVPRADNPAVNAKGTVKPSDKPIVASETMRGFIRHFSKDRPSALSFLSLKALIVVPESTECSRCPRSASRSRWYSPSLLVGNTRFLMQVSTILIFVWWVIRSVAGNVARMFGDGKSSYLMVHVFKVWLSCLFRDFSLVQPQCWNRASTRAETFTRYSDSACMFLCVFAVRWCTCTTITRMRCSILHYGQWLDATSSLVP